MELKEKLRRILKEKYGMENDAEIIKEIRASQGIDLGIFVNPYEKDEVKPRNNSGYSESCRMAERCMGVLYCEL